MKTATETIEYARSLVCLDAKRQAEFNNAMVEGRLHHAAELLFQAYADDIAILDHGKFVAALDLAFTLTK